MIPKSTKKFYVTVAVVFGLFVLLAFLGIKYASRSLRPIFYGAAMAYIFKPMCNVFYSWIYRLFSKKYSSARSKKIAHCLSLICTYLVWGAIIYVLIATVLPTIMSSVISFGTNIPNLISYLINTVNTLASENELIAQFFGDALTEIGEDLNGFYELITKNWTKISEYLHPLATGVLDVVMESVTFIFNIFVGLIVSVYLLSGRKKLGAQAKMLSRSVFGRKWANIILEETRFADRMFSGFFIGSIIDSVIVGAVCYIACLIMNTPYSVLVSVIVAVTNLIPFFGPWIGMIPSVVIILTVSPFHALTFGVMVWVLQQIDGNILGPKIKGSKTGLSSFWVLFAILLFGGLFGFPGMVVGVPIFAVIYDICGKLMRYCLNRRGEGDVIKSYEEEFLEEDAQQVHSGRQRIKIFREKDVEAQKMKKQLTEITPDEGEITSEAPRQEFTPSEEHDEEESDREMERFNSKM